MSLLIDKLSCTQRSDYLPILRNQRVQSWHEIVRNSLLLSFITTNRHENEFKNKLWYRNSQTNVIVKLNFKSVSHVSLIAL